MTRHRIAQIGENRNPKSPENRPQTRRFLQIRLLQLRRSATPFNGLAVLHGRLSIRTGSYSTADYALAPAATVCSTSRVALRRMARSATAAPVQHPHPTFGSCRGWNTAD